MNRIDDTYLAEWKHGQSEWNNRVLDRKSLTAFNEQLLLRQLVEIADVDAGVEHRVRVRAERWVQRLEEFVQARLVAAAVIRLPE